MTESQVSEHRSIDKAMDAYRKAATLVPDNMAVTMRIGALLERDDKYVAATTRYSEFVRNWPRVFEPRYRLAATLGMSDRWLELIPNAPAEDADKFVELLSSPSEAERQLGTQDLLNGRELHGLLLAGAGEQWNDLVA